MTEQEIWRAVPRYEGRYEVSNKGRVRSLDRTITYTKVSGASTQTSFRGKILTQRKSKYDGQLYVMFSDCGRQKSMSVARLVAQAFLGCTDSVQYVYHRDNDAENNAVENLYLGTRRAGRRIELRDRESGEVYKSIGEVSRLHGISEYKVKKSVEEKRSVGGRFYEFVDADGR